MSTISVEKITNVDLLRRANSFTTSKESKMTLAQAYKCGHSPIRTQLFWIELTEIPLFVASQLVRSHIGVQFFQLSKRTDRGGTDFRDVCRTYARIIESQCCNIENQTEEIVFDENEIEIPLNNLRATAEAIADLSNEFDRYAPTDLAFIVNAEAIINMAHKRLCNKASKETREVIQGICYEIEHYDADLYKHLVPQCIFRGVCPEPKSCGYIKTHGFVEARNEYINLFNK